MRKLRQCLPESLFLNSSRCATRFGLADESVDGGEHKKLEVIHSFDPFHGNAHGGLSPGGKKGNNNSSKHGIYESGLSEDEKKFYLSIKMGDLQQQTRVRRIQLRCAR